MNGLPRMFFHTSRSLRMILEVNQNITALVENLLSLTYVIRIRYQKHFYLLVVKTDILQMTILIIGPDHKKDMEDIK